MTITQSKLPLFLFLSVVFLLTPFLSLVLSLFLLRNDLSGNRKRVELYIVFISLFFGILAFTQSTSVGDISRTYEKLRFFSDGLSIPQSILFVVANDLSPLFWSVNVLLYKVTDNVQYISLLWVFIIYYCSLKSLLLLLDYSNVEKGKVVYIGVLSVILGFIIFSQVTELMKQAIAAAVFVLGYTHLLRGGKIKGIVCLIMAVLIHISVLFLFPVLLSLFLKKQKPLLVLMFVSFFFRPFNLLVLIGFLGVGNDLLNEKIEGYSQYMENFYSPTAITFLGLFFLFFLLILLVYYFKPSNKVLLNACMIFVIVLNLSYSNNHNYTRLLLNLFPFFEMLFVALLTCKGASYIRLKEMLVVLLFLTTFINCSFLYKRTAPNAGYKTSFMDNSIIKIVTSTSFDYLNYKAIDYSESL